MSSGLAKCFAAQNFYNNFSRLCRSKVLLHSYKRTLYISPIVLAKYYTDKHEWIDIPEGKDIGTIGITDYAQDQLGDIVYVQLPEVGLQLELDDIAGVLESVKAASDVYSPLTGEVTEVNEFVADNPGTINSDPNGEGWLYKMKVGEASEVDSLMSTKSLMLEAQYKEYLTTQA